MLDSLFGNKVIENSFFLSFTKPHIVDLLNSSTRIHVIAGEYLYKYDQISSNSSAC